MNTPLTRRSFLRQTSLATAGISLAGSPLVRAARRISPNDKLNIAMIGTANQAGWNLGNITSENVVALALGLSAIPHT